MDIAVVTIFPEMFNSFFESGILRIAVKKRAINVSLTNPRDFTNDLYKSVDDYPYGGNAGMLLKPEPLEAAIKKIKDMENFKNAPVVYLSPQGRQLKQSMLEYYSKVSSLIFLCGHYKGIDERIIELFVDEEISIGDYIISGGEVAVMVLIDGIVRLLPGVLGNIDSAMEDSFVNNLLDCPHYTRPEIFLGRKVPEVLLSGNHANIKKWRHYQMLKKTWEKRPDLIGKLELNEEDKKIINSFKKDEK